MFFGANWKRHLKETHNLSDRSRTLMVKKREEKKFKLELPFDYHSSRFFALLFPVIYLVALGIFCFEYKIIPGPEFLVLGILIYAAYNQRTWRALKDWLPFVTVFISYEIMYSIVGAIANNLHAGPYNFDLQLFGQIPSLTLQQTIRLPALDYLGAFFYSIYFFVPTIFAFILPWFAMHSHLLYYSPSPSLPSTNPWKLKPSDNLSTHPTKFVCPIALD